MLLPTLIGLISISLGLSDIVAASHPTFQSEFTDSIGIRVKHHSANAVCNGGAPSHSGWADLGPHHVFFWLFEARHDKDNAPVMVWFTGGPGGSSQASAFVENGDCLFDPATNSTIRNEHGWTESYNMVYIDQPIGVGLSYVDSTGDDHDLPGTVDEASLDVVRFLRLFAQAFPDLARNPIHLVGESYGGRYVPAYGDAVLKYNALTGATNGYRTIPLASLVSISAWTRPSVQIPSMYAAACYPFKGYPPSLDAAPCAEMADAVQQCADLLAACHQTVDRLVCGYAGTFCEENVSNVIEAQHTNKYDRRMRCPRPGDCYPIMGQMQDWFNSDDVFVRLLDVPEQTHGHVESYAFLSTAVAGRFRATSDFWTDSDHYLESILRAKNTVPMLFTASDADVLVNPLGLRETLEQVRWHGRPTFKSAAWQTLPWKTQAGGPAGRVKKSAGLWYVELAEAGHMAPYDQREAVLTLMKEWVAHTDVYPVAAAQDIGGQEVMGGDYGL